MKYKPTRRRTARKSMIAFQVALNGKPICLAGVGMNGVLTSMVEWMGGKKLGKGVLKKHLRLIVGGLDTATKEHLYWETPKIRVGDEVAIKVVKVFSVDPGTRYRPSNAKARP